MTKIHCDKEEKRRKKKEERKKKKEERKKKKETIRGQRARRKFLQRNGAWVAHVFNGNI